MSYHGMLRLTAAVAVLAACGPPLPPRVIEFPTTAPDAIDLIEGEAPDDYERVAEISLRYFGVGAEEEALRRARALVAELGADALAFRLVPVTRTRRSALARQRAALAVYESAPYLNARIGCSVSRYTLSPEYDGTGRRVGFSLECYDSDPFAHPESPDQPDSFDAGHDFVRGYSLVGWALIRGSKQAGGGERSES